MSAPAIACTGPVLQRFDLVRLQNLLCRNLRIFQEVDQRLERFALVDQRLERFAFLRI